MVQYRNWEFLGGGLLPPSEYQDFILCHHLYHCTPEELNRQDARTVALHLEFWAHEQKRKAKRKPPKG